MEFYSAIKTMMNNDTCNNLIESEMHFAKRRQAQNATSSLIQHM